MRDIVVGNWKIEVSGPYPCWCKIYYEGNKNHPQGTLGGIHHKELRDLEYATQQAMRECRQLLRNDKDEV